METAKVAADVYRQFGALDFLILCMCLALGYLIYRIVKAQDALAEKMAKLVDSQQQHDARGGLIQQNQQMMHETCKDHGERITQMHQGMNDFKEDVTDRLNKVEKEIAVLKGR